VIDIQQAAQRAVGGVALDRIPQTYPAHQSPHDALEGSTREQTRAVVADVPLTQSIIDWSVDQIRGALWAHNYGVFYESGLLTDAILGDPRVQATLGSLNSALFGREVVFTPANDSNAARECCDAWRRAWPRLAGTSTFTTIGAYSKLMGWSPSQIVWDTTKPVWNPELRPWHPSYTYYHWDARKYVAISRDGPVAILPGNAKWCVHFPFGEYRGWIRGAVRAVSEPWLLRHQSFRDHGRFNEVHGLPIKKAIVPAACAQDQRDAYASALANLGRETTIMVSRGVDGNNGYDLELVEPTDDAWQSFTGLVDRCDMDIVLALMFQNLTTEVTGGAFAATKSHMDVRDQSVAYDNLAWAWTIYQQIARPFAWLNFGDADLAPMTAWDVTPRAELTANAEQFNKFGTAIEVLRRGGIEFDDPEEVRKFAAHTFGLKGLPKFKIVEPVGPGAGAAAATGKPGEPEAKATDPTEPSEQNDPKEPGA
jgi:hypothetical protein